MEAACSHVSFAINHYLSLIACPLVDNCLTFVLHVTLIYVSVNPLNKLVVIFKPKLNIHCGSCSQGGKITYNSKYTYSILRLFYLS